MVLIPLGVTNNVFSVLVPLKCTCMPLAWQTIFETFLLVPWIYGTTMVMFLLFLVGCWLLPIVASTVVVVSLGMSCWCDWNPG